MSVTKDFVMKVAIGKFGTAVMEIKESLSEFSIDKSTDIHPELIAEEIKECGIEDWADWTLDDVPNEPGIYTFRGSVRFDEDSADYSMTCDEV